jgi:hypothetical protein
VGMAAFRHQCQTTLGKVADVLRIV